MRLALRRFHLQGIGPAGARFDPLTVDLTDRDAAVRTAVLFLENGGGKSVLLRLLLAVVLPGRRQVVGGARLDAYVLSGDTGHVALEWDLPDGGRLVTGTVLEWRNRARSSSGANLLQSWYSFLPRAASLTFEGLPFTEEGHRVTRRGFVERLTDWSRSDPALQLVVEESPSAWAGHLLRATPLDPEAFRYQRQMNADEAEAENLFAGIASDDDFVRFIVEAIHDPDEVGDFAGLVSEYAGQLGRRRELETEQSFCAVAADALRPFGAAQADWQDALVARDRLRQAAGRFRLRLESAAAAQRERSGRAQAAADGAEVEATDLDKRAKQASDVASELRRLEAEFRHQDALSAQKDADRDLVRHRLEVTAWDGAGVIVTLRAAEGEAAQLRAAQESVARELVPLRQQADRADSRFAGRLLAEAVGWKQRSKEEAAAGQQASAEAEDAASVAARAGTASGEASATASSLRERAAEVAAAETAARVAGQIRPGEPVPVSLGRSREEAVAAVAARDAAQRRRSALDLEIFARQAERAEREARRADFDARHGAARRELDDHVAAGDVVLSHDRVAQLVPGAEDFWAVAAILVERLSDLVVAAEAEAKLAQTAIADTSAALDALGAEGLLPPAPDVRRVWDAVVAAGIPATSGWVRLARLHDADERRSILETNPALAGGVVVADPARLGEARDAVSAAGVETDAVVLLGTADQLNLPGHGVAAPLRRALYDPEWAERERERLAGRLESERACRDAALSSLAVDEPLLHEACDLLRRCPVDRREQLKTQVQELEEALSTEKAALGQVVATIDAMAADRAAAADQEVEAAAEVPRKESAALRLAELAEALSRAEGWLAEATAAEERAASERAEAASATLREGDARRRAERARSEAAAALAAMDGCRSEAARRSAEPVDPGDGPEIEVLRAEADAARAAYDSERAGRDLTPQLQSAEAHAQRLRQARSDLGVEVASRAEALASLPGAATESVRRRRRAGAQDDAEQAEAVLRRCTEAVGSARAVLEDRTPKRGGRHVVLDATDEPSDAEDASRRATEAQSAFLGLRERHRERSAAAEAARRDADTARQKAQLLGQSARFLPEPPEPPSDDVVPYDGTPEEAQRDSEDMARRLSEFDGKAGEAERRLDRAAERVRAVAASPLYVRMGGVRVALAEEGLDSLGSRAATLADELDAMRASVEAELSDLARHREGIVVRLSTLTGAYLAHLARLERLSTLPDGLGEWSRQAFLTVAFDRVDGAALPERLGAVVDAAVDDPKLRKGVALLMAALRASVRATGAGDGLVGEGRSFRVRIIRPNRSMHLQWAGPGELAREFSGGMKLTAAICTYCTLAALRAATRSTGRLIDSGPGPLFLDNPLGKASADYLIDLQLKLADRLGVQLVYTTGVWDLEALGAYEKLVRLRNLTDLRRNVQRLRVEAVGRLPVPDGTLVDATALTVRRNGA